MTATGPGQDVGVEALDAFFARTPRLAVAFSGGCDSSFLLAAALRAGCDVKAYGVRTAFQPAFEIDDARRLARELGAEFELIDADVLAQGGICANGPDRCYRCKTFIFSTILAHMAQDGFQVLADGTNVTDDPANRPGFQALAELGVVSPLRRAGMTKDAVRAASRELALFTATSPASRAWPCTWGRAGRSRPRRSPKRPRASASRAGSGRERGPACRALHPRD
ncbi:7-cyano-7-deazaguanine synthase [Eggerthella guodeyinii]|uniref:7-cyano-7-deazaguanine synthase n=1 Tax=Eggerthella guodeyinii TaxID=2690837 RepID=UPI001F29AB41|nr:7-cyano-7-deazaguanine synthase [Eggerthella guodeyinii]